MTEREVQDWLRAQVAASRGANHQEIDVADPDAIDSLEGVEVAIAAEVHFRIRIPNSSLDRRTCRSIAGLARLIRRLVDADARRTA